MAAEAYRNHHNHDREKSRSDQVTAALRALQLVTEPGQQDSWQSSHEGQQPALPPDHAQAARPGDAEKQAWDISQLRGRLVEVSSWPGGSALTWCIQAARQAQQAADPVAWVGLASDQPFPPDLAANGVDLDSFLFVRLPEPAPWARIQAAEDLLRSGAFGLVMVDLMPPVMAPDRRLPPWPPRIRDAQLGRLLKLAQAHQAALLCLTARAAGAASLGSLVSLHARASLHIPAPRGSSQVSQQATVYLRADKDKYRSPGWQQQQTIHVAPGLC